MSSFAKFLVPGRGATAALQRIFANDVDVAPGRIVYTQWLNPRAGIEADLTVTRLAGDAFLVVTAAAGARRDLAWLRRHLGEDATVADMTSAEATLCVMGPNSRALLQEVSGAELSNAAHPFGTWREIELGCARVRAHRITYVGELGWELYAPREFARAAFDAIVEAGAAHGLRLAGLHALDNCRIEKACRQWGHDIGDEDTPLEAGLMFAVKPDKGDFIGRDALLRRRDAATDRRLAQFLPSDPAAMLYHDEPIWADGRMLGRTTSGAYGHTLGGAVALGYVRDPGGDPAAMIRAATVEIEVAGRRVPARASLSPLYDPRSQRVRA
jgi:4-methylaminobutanoate oxidase (formaldehyde-forming)